VRRSRHVPGVRNYFPCRQLRTPFTPRAICVGEDERPRSLLIFLQEARQPAATFAPAQAATVPFRKRHRCTLAGSLRASGRCNRHEFVQGPTAVGVSYLSGFSTAGLCTQDTLYRRTTCHSSNRPESLSLNLSVCLGEIGVRSSGAWVNPTSRSSRYVVLQESGHLCSLAIRLTAAGVKDLSTCATTSTTTRGEFVPPTTRRRDVEGTSGVEAARAGATSGWSITGRPSHGASS